MNLPQPFRICLKILNLLFGYIFALMENLEVNFRDHTSGYYAMEISYVYDKTIQLHLVHLKHNNNNRLFFLHFTFLMLLQSNKT